MLNTFSPPNSSHKPCLDMPSPIPARGQLSLGESFMTISSEDRKPGPGKRTEVPGLPQLSPYLGLSFTLHCDKQAVLQNSSPFLPASPPVFETSPAIRYTIVLKQCPAWGVRFPRAPHSLQASFWFLILVMAPPPPCDLGRH